MSHRSRWFGATAVALSGLIALAVPSSAAPTADPAEAAAGWLGRQFVGGDHLETSYDGDSFPDAGLTIDGIIALTAAGVGGDTSSAALGWLGDPANLAGYIGDGTTESYAGSTAKLALGVQIRSQNPRSFGADGVDLIERLSSRQQDNGRFTDLSEWGDFSGTFSQSFALLALHRAGESEQVSIGADYLVSQQCADGGFPQNFETEPCVSQVDATSLAVQALMAVGSSPAAGEAADYLESQADGDGGFGNANSTGLAAAALAVAGRPAASDAVTVLAGWQVGCSAPAADRGAIAFDDAGLDDRAVRATAQALPGLVGADLATLSASDAEEPSLPTLSCEPDTSTTTTSTTSTTAPTSTSTSVPGSTSSTSAPVPTTSPAGQVPTPLSRTGTTGHAVGASRSTQSSLPATGADVTDQVRLAIISIGAGLALVLAARSRAAAR